MFNGESGYSLSDIAAVSGKNNENMWNDGGAWWIIILFLFCFAGWGGNSWGGNNGSTTREDITYGLDMSNLKCGQTSLASDGSGTAYATGSTITPTGDVTLYAQWEKTTPTIRAKINGSIVTGLFYIKANNAIHLVSEAYVKVNGVWKQIE